MERLRVILGQLEDSSVSQELSQAIGSQAVSGQEEYDPVTQHGGLIVGKALAKAGVKFVFTLAGGHISPILVGCKREGIRVIDVRDEATAAFAADATGRLTGIPGVAIVTAGPGLTNTITAIKNAQMAEVPMIIIGGATAIILKGRGSLQDIDQAALMAPHVKRLELITSVDHIWSKLEAGFETALSDVPGPVFFEFPLEVLYPQAMMQAQLMSASNPPTGIPLSAAQIQARLQDWYLRRHVQNTYGTGDAHAKAATSEFRLRVYRIPAVPSVVKAGYQALVKSKRPVIVLGSQAVKAGETDWVINALESIGAPVYLSGMARGLLGTSHALLMRHNRKQALQKSDCVLVIGVAVDFRLNYGRHVPKSAFFGMINLNPDALEKNKDIRSRNLSALADPAFYLRDLDALWKKSSRSGVNFSDWVQECRASDEKREVEILKLSGESTSEGVNPLFLFKQLNQHLDPDSIIVADGGDFVGTASYTLFPRQPLSWLDPGAFGTLGVGGGMAIAAKTVRPNAEVWLIYGDGSSAYSLAEIDTCVRHNLPIIAVIGNDAAWMQILRDQVVVLGDDVACTLRPGTRYDLVAKGYGGEGILVTNHSEVLPAILTAKQLARQGVPVVINCLLQKSSFREGSLSV